MEDKSEMIVKSVGKIIFDNDNDNASCFQTYTNKKSSRIYT